MLLLDAGNSSLKCLLVETDRRQRFDWNAEWVWQQISDAFSDWGEQPAWLASVAPAAVTARIEASWNSLYPGAPMRRLTSLPELGGLSNGYEQPQQLGVDRWLALLGASERAQGDAIVIDAGSAITLDLLSRRQGHLGGAILPGLQTGPERFYSLFPQIDFSDPALQPGDRPGRNTFDCLHPVGGKALLPQLTKLLRQWRGLLEEPVSVLLCGRDAEALAAALPVESRIEPELVFRGMLKQIEALG